MKESAECQSDWFFLNQGESFWQEFLNLAENQRVASVNVVEEHAKEANVSENAAHAL